MVTRNVVLTETQDHLVQALVASGRYQNVSEAMRAGLRLLEQEEAQITGQLDHPGVVLGRADFMVTIRGVNVYPTAVENLVSEVPGLSHHYELHISRVDGMDRMLVRAEANGSEGCSELAVRPAPHTSPGPSLAPIPTSRRFDLEPPREPG